MVGARGLAHPSWLEVLLELGRLLLGQMQQVEAGKGGCRTAALAMSTKSASVAASQLLCGFGEEMNVLKCGEIRQSEDLFSIRMSPC